MQSCNSPDFDYYEQKKVNLTDIEINIDGKYETVPEQLLITLKLNTEIN